MALPHGKPLKESIDPGEVPNKLSYVDLGKDGKHMPTTPSKPKLVSEFKTFPSLEFNSDLQATIEDLSSDTLKETAKFTIKIIESLTDPPLVSKKLGYPPLLPVLTKQPSILKSDRKVSAVISTPVKLTAEKGRGPYAKC